MRTTLANQLAILAYRIAAESAIVGATRVKSAEHLHKVIVAVLLLLHLKCEEC